MLGKDVKLEQAQEGVGDVMRGKRRRARGRRRGEGGGREIPKKNRINGREEHPTFMDIWARGQLMPKTELSRKKTGVGDRERDE